MVMILDQNVISLQSVKFHAILVLLSRWPLLVLSFDLVLWLPTPILLQKGMCYLFYIKRGIVSYSKLKHKGEMLLPKKKKKKKKWKRKREREMERKEKLDK